jgi:hypothetical protein
MKEKDLEDWRIGDERKRHGGRENDICIEYLQREYEITQPTLIMEPNLILYHAVYYVVHTMYIYVDLPKWKRKLFLIALALHIFKNCQKCQQE